MFYNLYKVLSTPYSMNHKHPPTKRSGAHTAADQSQRDNKLTRDKIA